jgi:hypothetical protein
MRSTNKKARMRTPVAAVLAASLTAAAAARAANANEVRAGADLVLHAHLGSADGSEEERRSKERRALGRKLEERLFGAELCAILGSGARLERLARDGRLDDYLAGHSHAGQPLTAFLGGLMKEARPLKGKKAVSYSGRFASFTRTFGLDLLGEMTPKPGKPPVPAHLDELERTAGIKGAHLVLFPSLDVLGADARASAESFARRIGAGLVLAPPEGDADAEAVLVERALAALPLPG